MEQDVNHSQIDYSTKNYSTGEKKYLDQIVAALKNKNLVSFMLYDYQHVPWRRLTDNGITLKRFSSKSDLAGLAPGEEIACFDRLSNFRYYKGITKSADGKRFLQLMNDTLDENSLFLPYSPITKLYNFKAGKKLMNKKNLLEVAESKSEFSELIDSNIKQLDWIPLNNATFDLLKQFVETPNGAVLRPDKGQGGTSVFLLRNKEDIQNATNHIMQGDVENQNSYYFSAYIPSHPISASGCIFENGKIKVYPSSYQLIGVEQCGPSPFRYCGGDYSTAKFLSYSNLIEIEKALKTTGEKLYELGFRGLFGMDFILDYYDQLFYIETNIRFVSPHYLIEHFSHPNGISDPFLDHLSAFLGINPSEFPSLNEWKTIQTGAQVIMYNKTDKPIIRTKEVANLEEENITNPIMGISDLTTPIDVNAPVATIRTNEAASIEGKLLPNIDNAIDKIYHSYELYGDFEDNQSSNAV